MILGTGLYKINDVASLIRLYMIICLKKLSNLDCQDCDAKFAKIIQGNVIHAVT